VETESGAVFVVDSGCDFRAQALRCGLHVLDALFLTHAHADHLHGLDDVRPFTWRTPLPVYGGGETISALRNRFDYIFKETQKGGGKPRINTFVIDSAVKFMGVEILPVPVKHGSLDVLGYIFHENQKKAAYVTDCSFVPGTPPSRVASGGAQPSGDCAESGKTSFDALADCDALVLGALRVNPHPTHFSFDEAFELIAALRAKSGTLSPLKKIFFTHISHESSHMEIKRFCEAAVKRYGLNGASVEPAFDGLKIHI
jgi:phosphoribosyl 1,2-cyclic phosphate phosphodiesterase